MTTTKPTTMQEAAGAFLNAADTFARFLADDGSVETAWFLRGVADALTRGTAEDMSGNEYHRPYARGFAAASNA